MMDQAIKAKWTEVLRGGKYDQTQLVLKDAGLTDTDQQILADMSGGGKTSTEIADYIDATL